MPVFSVPEMTIAKYNDGSSIRAGDTVVPCVIVVDSNGKLASVRGAPINIADTTSPVLSAQYAVTQTLGSYEFKPSAGTVTDDSSGLLKVYLVLTLQSATTSFLQNIVGSFTSGYSVADLTNYMRDTPVQLNTLGLATSQVYDSGTSAFREIKEGDSVYAHLVARDPSGLFRSQSVFVNPVADRTPPTGLESVALGTVTFNSIMVTNLNSIVDGGDGVSMITLHYGTSSTIGTGTANVTFAPASNYNITGMDDATLYYVWVSATDGTNVAGPTLVGSTRTLDSTDPVIANFDVTQTTPYTFTASAGTITDNAAGPLKAYLVMATTPMSTAALSSIYGTVEAPAKREGVEYTADAALAISTIGLSTTKYWTGSAFAPISESAPASPHQLYAHLFVLDASNNDNSATNPGVAKVVVDSTPPQAAGTVTLAADGSDTMTVAWGASVTDGRGLASAAVYYSTTAPASTSLAGITAWKAAAGTSYYTLPSLATLAASGSVSVTGLSGATTYYAYLCAQDGGGNVGNFITTPSSVTTDAAGAPTIGMFEASRFTDPTDPSFVSKSGSPTMVGTDTYCSGTASGGFVFKLFDTIPTSFTLGLRLKFTNINTFHVTNTNNVVNNIRFYLNGSLGGRTKLVVFSFATQQFYDPNPTNYPGILTEDGWRILYSSTNIFKTSYFWFFLVGTPGQADYRMIMYDSDDTTVTFNQIVDRSAIPSMSGTLQLLCDDILTRTQNHVTIDKFYFKDQADVSVSPSQTMTVPTMSDVNNDTLWRSFARYYTTHWPGSIEWAIPATHFVQDAAYSAYTAKDSDGSVWVIARDTFVMGGSPTHATDPNWITIAVGTSFTQDTPTNRQRALYWLVTVQGLKLA